MIGPTIGGVDCWVEPCKYVMEIRSRDAIASEF
jgi:hypothetical protein